jgi:hypothetical protein
MEERIAALFTHVLIVCNQMSLIGREMCAIDSCDRTGKARLR